MKSNKFVQFYDKDSKPILSAQGLIDYDKRIKRHEAIIKSLTEAKNVPEGAVYWQIKQTILKSVVKVTPLYLIEYDN